MRVSGFRRASAFSKGFMRYLRKKVGITDRTRAFHSFRHSFKDAARDSEVDRTLNDILTGHKDPTVAADYGQELYSLKSLTAAMRKVTYDGLDLEHLHAGSLEPAKAP